eukprot:5475527-Pyramimonas_sp.AAC.1
MRVRSCSAASERTKDQRMPSRGPSLTRKPITGKPAGVIWGAPGSDLKAKPCDLTKPKKRSTLI